jgi:hypothetical protein
MTNSLRQLKFQKRPIFTMVFVVFTMVFVALTMVFVASTMVFVVATRAFVSLTMVFVILTVVFALSTMVFVILTVVFALSTMVFVVLTMVFVVPTVVFVILTMVFVVSTMVSSINGVLPQRARVADRLKKQSAEQLVIMAGAVITGLTNNPAFPAPTVDLKAVQAAADDLNAALAAQTHGGSAATAEKNNKQEALIALLHKLKHYVEENCGNDLAVALSGGFPTAASTRMRSPLANPSILNVRLSNSGELVVKVTPITRAKCYEVRQAAVSAGNTPGPWQAVGLFADSRLMPINGLTPEMTYIFQVRAVGGSTGCSDWSNPVSRMCI